VPMPPKGWAWEDAWGVASESQDIFSIFLESPFGRKGQKVKVKKPMLDRSIGFFIN